MLPDPLHPAVVHFPIAIAVGLPLFIAAALLAIRHGDSVRRAWAVPVALAATLAAATFLVVRTGQAEEDRVERIVSESTLEHHEEAAERVQMLAALLVAVSAFGLLRGKFGNGARLASFGLAIVLLVLVIQVASAGGRLVYRENAASAYLQDLPVRKTPDTSE
jgi:uncharacterized membrane protein